MKNIDFTDFFNVFLSGATIRGNFIDLARFTWNLAKNRQESSFCELTGVAPDDIILLYINKPL